MRLALAALLLAACPDWVTRPTQVRFDAPKTGKVGEPLTVVFHELDQANGRQWKMCLAESCVDVPEGAKEIEVVPAQAGDLDIEARSDHVSGKAVDGFVMVAHGRVSVAP